MNRRTLIAAVVLVGVGMVLGILLMSHLGAGAAPRALQAQQRSQLGAPNPPIAQPSELVRQLNRAFVDVANAVLPSVVGIRVYQRGSESPSRFFEFFGPFRRFFEDEERGSPEAPPPPREVQGAGVIITEDGYIVTNNHVVERVKEEDLRVVLHDGKELRAKIIGRDPLTDLALLKVDAKGLKPAYFGNVEDIQVGEWVIAVGNPLGLRSSVTAGIISATGRGGLGLQRDSYGVENFIQTDAPINPGNSGGGLFTLSGALIGINTAIATTTGFYQGYGFAIPIDIVRAVVEDLIEDGKIDRGYIGVQIQPVDDVMAKALGLDSPRGAAVARVLKGGAAEQADIKVGDVILALDGTPVRSPNHLQALVAMRRAGQKVRLTIWRDGKTIEKVVTLRPRDQDTTAARAEAGSEEESSEGKPAVDLERLGLAVAPLSPEKREQLEIDSGIEVTRVKAYSPAWEQGLRRGDVITHVGNTPVKSVAEFRRLLGQRKPGDAVLLRVLSVAPNGEVIERLVAIELPS